LERVDTNVKPINTPYALPYV